MTSTGAAGLGKGRTAVDVLAALFPCGSVTGAPKIRAMEVIAEIEKEPRGVYTGSIGWVGPGGEGGFNVAIRTLVIPEEPGALARPEPGLALRWRPERYRPPRVRACWRLAAALRPRQPGCRSRPLRPLRAFRSRGGASPRPQPIWTGHG